MAARHRLISGLFFFFLFVCLRVGAEGGDPVQNGSADLRAFDFTDGRTVQLSGFWDFWWNTLLPPEALAPDEIMDSSRLVRLPGQWNAPDATGNRLSPVGCATYRMELILPENRQYGIFLYQMVSAYTLFINGELVAGNGIVSDNPERTVPEYRAQTVFFTPVDGRAVLVLHIANRDYRNAGLWKPLLLGLPETIARESDRKLIIEMFSLGAIIIIGLYNLALFAFRKKERSPLWFALFCMVVACRLCATGHTAVSIFFPAFPWELQVKMELAIFHLGALFSVLFVRSVFPAEFPEKPFQALVVIYSVLTALALILPVVIYNRLVTVLEISGMAGLLLILFALARAFFRNRQYALLFIIGYLVLAVIAVNDILYSRNVINTAYLFPIALVIFILNQAVVLARSLSQSFREVASLSQRLVTVNASLEQQNEQLADLSQNLEDKINERTRELLDAYDEIKRLALVDTLTGLANRRKVLSLIEFEEKRVRREQYQYVIAMIDVDDFKKINDTYGHEAGDLVLVEMASALTDIIRQEDQACRWGGEEFLILFSGQTLEKARVIAEKIRRAIEELEIHYNSVTLRITVTIGLSISRPGISYTECIKEADDAMYRGKKEGKNRVLA